jgi:hypothetical protein
MPTRKVVRGLRSYRNCWLEISEKASSARSIISNFRLRFSPPSLRFLTELSKRLQ